MPNGDRTGPYGEGSMTGRSMGYCSGSDMSGNADGRGRARGFGHGGSGRGFGFRRGMGAFNHHWFGGGNFDVSEKTLLENEKRLLHDQLESLKKRLSALGDQDS
ncbi:MAG: DUF5320 domain-containing protein [Bacteroidales bacterium]|nr:DUF5320 domain-containing protein [Bacteroidales bacterium]